MFSNPCIALELLCYPFNPRLSAELKSRNNKYVVLQDKRYNFHPTENLILRQRKEPKSLRTQYQVINQNKTKSKRY